MNLKAAFTLWALLLAPGVASGPAEAAARTRFWNLTGATITRFELAPAGTESYGPDQCRNDKDGAVDHDERLNITGTPPGTYDARVVFKDGRTCRARAIRVEEGKVFSLEPGELTECTKK